MIRLSFATVVAMLFISHASAGTIFNVDLSSYATNFCCWGTPESTAVEGGVSNTGSTLTFSDPNADYVAVGATPPFSGYYSGSVTINTNDSSLLSNNVVVNTLLNLFNGQTGNDVTITFTNSLAQTAVFTLAAGATIRDYHNNNNGGDTLTGSGTGVTAINWWNNGVIDTNADTSIEPDQRLDAQTFVLPASWAGTTLTSLQITYAGPNSSDAVLSAFQVDDMGTTTATPEPSTVLLAGAGLLLVAFRWARKTESR